MIYSQPLLLGKLASRFNLLIYYMKNFKTDTEAKAKILEKWSFGFELEGLFSRELQSISLSTDHNYSSAGWKSDGSVHNVVADFSDFARIRGIHCSSCNDTGYYMQDCECDYECDYGSHEHGDGDCNNDACEEEGEVEQDHEHSEVCCDLEEHEHDEECLPCYSDDEYHEMSCEDCDGDTEEGNRASEFASPVYEDIDEALTELSKFNSETHAYNETCGLHFHIGAKNEKWQRQLWQLVGNMDLLERLHNEALGYCKCQKDRTLSQLDPNLQRSRFCEKTKTPLSLVMDFKNSQKYRFVRFHNEYKTLEFRFLSPCKHKVENVKKLLNTLLDFATSSDTVKEIGEAEIREEDSNIIEFIMKPRNQQEIEKYQLTRMEEKELLKRDLDRDFKIYLERNYGRIPYTELSESRKADLLVEVFISAHNVEGWGEYVGVRADHGRAYLDNLDLLDQLAYEKYVHQLSRMQSWQRDRGRTNNDEQITILGLTRQIVQPVMVNSRSSGTFIYGNNAEAWVTNEARINRQMSNYADARTIIDSIISNN